MKLLGFIIFLCLAQACDPYGFGFKKNPAYVLDEAFQAVMALDDSAFREVSGREAFCLYGNQDGINYLREKLSINARDIELKPTKLESKYLMVPQINYFSYYQERYVVDILDKTTKEAFLKTVVDCHYGQAGEKDEKYRDLNPKKYKMKECRLIKIIPTTFKTLPITSRCENLKVIL